MRNSRKKCNRPTHNTIMKFISHKGHDAAVENHSAPYYLIFIKFPSLDSRGRLRNRWNSCHCCNVLIGSQPARKTARMAAKKCLMKFIEILRQTLHEMQICIAREQYLRRTARGKMKFRLSARNSVLQLHNLCGDSVEFRVTSVPTNVILNAINGVIWALDVPVSTAPL